MKVTMKNSKTGKVKEIKVGWSWTLFLFSGLFGLPLFLRKLHVWGGVCLGLWMVRYTLAKRGVASITLTVIFLGIQIFLGIKGNEFTAKNYLKRGWEFTDPDSDVVMLANGEWGLK